MLFNGTYLVLSNWFLRTECLWLNVPLPESWPTNLTGYPSSNKEPNAKASAVDQSISKPFFTFNFLLSNIFEIVLWRFMSLGIVFILFEISCNFFISKPVTPLLSLPLAGLYLDHVPSNHSILGL